MPSLSKPPPAPDVLTLPTLPTAAVLARLQRGEPVTVFGVRLARHADIARVAQASGHQVLWVDLEHSAMPIDAAGQICATALDLGLLPLVRVPEHELGVIGRLLDAGALGIIAPRVETAAQAAAVVAACRFAPQGHRSAIATLPQLGLARLPPARLYELVNAATLVQILVESPRGIANLAEIAAVPGVDMIAIGTNDLSAELGVPGAFSHPLVREAHASALAACAAARKPLAIGGVSDAAYSAELVRQGAAPWLMTAIDSDLLLAAAQDRNLQVLAAHAASARQAQLAAAPLFTSTTQPPP